MSQLSTRDQHTMLNIYSIITVKNQTYNSTDRTLNNVENNNKSLLRIVLTKRLTVNFN